MGVPEKTAPPPSPPPYAENDVLPPDGPPPGGRSTAQPPQINKLNLNGKRQPVPILTNACANDSLRAVMVFRRDHLKPKIVRVTGDVYAVDMAFIGPPQTCRLLLNNEFVDEPLQFTQTRDLVTFDIHGPPQAMLELYADYRIRAFEDPNDNERFFTAVFPRPCAVSGQFLDLPDHVVLRNTRPHVAYPDVCDGLEFAYYVAE